MLEATTAVVRWAHIGGAAVALFSLFIPWLARKGGPLHRRAGWVYVWAMAELAVTALALCALRLADTEPANDSGAIFLAYVALIAGAATSTGVRALRTRARTGAHRHPWDLGVSAALVLGGLAMIAFGYGQGSVLFAAFGALGIFQASGELRFWLRPPRSKAESVLAHLGSMGAASVATVTAFFVVNAGRLGLPSGSLWVWLGPPAVGGVVVGLFGVAWRRKLSPVRPAPTGAPASPVG